MTKLSDLGPRFPANCMGGKKLKSNFTSTTALNVASGSTSAICGKSCGMSGPGHEPLELETEVIEFPKRK